MEPDPSRTRIQLRSVVFDCPDPAELASFYAALLGGRVNEDADDWWEVHLEGLPIKLAFQAVDRYRAPDWPDGTPQQMHLDLAVTDLESTSRYACSLGATVLSGPHHEPGCVFVVHADPAGHPFCLCAERDAQ